jgi:hypothetical protein
MFISLGYSCQTRFTLDLVDPDQKRMPFDFNITSRPALIRAFETDGASLQHGEHSVTVYGMKSGDREGIEVSGMFFWHDYPLDEHKVRLHRDWPSKIATVNEKYAALWRRFAGLMRSDDPKTLVLSNSQRNLPDFAEDAADFDLKFGLGRQAFAEIAGALEAFGARNYRLKFLSRSVAELKETAELGDDRLDHRFLGPTTLRLDPKIALPLLADIGGGEGRDRSVGIPGHDAVSSDL